MRKAFKKKENICERYMYIPQLIAEKLDLVADVAQLILMCKDSSTHHLRELH